MSKAEQTGLFDGLFDGPTEDPIWGDRWLNQDKRQANEKPYGRQHLSTETEPVILDWRQAKEAMREAIDRADQNASPAWKRAYYDALCFVARREPEFTADEIWDRLNALSVLPAQHERRAAGGVVLRAVKNKVIEFIPHYLRPSRRKHCHQSRVQVYRSLVVGRPLSEIPQYE